MTVSSQNYFQIIGSIPHLPLIDPLSISNPENGMLIFSSVDSKPLIYTGTEWETLCTNNISTPTPQDYFIVKNGIPYLPSLNTTPSNPLSGSLYYSIADKAIMIYNGAIWRKMVELTSASITDNNGFVSGNAITTYKLPVLNSNPSPAGLSAGAIYINSISKTIRYFDGTSWNDVTCYPKIITSPITDNNTGRTAKGGGDVISNGGFNVTFTGICWSPVVNPDTSLTSKTEQIATGTGLGAFISSLTGLLPKTTYYVRAYAVSAQGIAYGDNVTFTTPVALPTIITLPADSISPMRAISGGEITEDGGSPVTKRGIIWSAQDDPLNDPSNSRTDDGSGVGKFPSTLMNLLGNTTYYVRAYAVNSAGTAYGNLIIFTTPPPVLATTGDGVKVTNITGTTAIASSTVLTNGGATISERGVCITTDHTTYQCFPSSTVNLSDVGPFVVNLTGLTGGTTYYIKAYAVNSAGTAYSSESSFNTAKLVSITTKTPSNVLGTTANSGGIIHDVGFSVITTLGICWDTIPDPTINVSTKTAEPFSGNGTGSYTSTMTGLQAGRTYYVKAFAINAAGVSYGQQEQITLPDSAKVITLAASSLFGTTATVGGNVLSDGGSNVTERGVCWSTNPNPTISNSHTSDGDGLGLFMSILTNLKESVVYHYRAFAKNAIGVSYGEDRTFTIMPDAPVVVTLNPHDITSLSAISGGNITHYGLAPITKRGVICSPVGDPIDDSNAIITDDGSGVGEFPSNLMNLLGNTNYFIRAYAVNAYGTFYGDLLHFITLPPVLASIHPPTISQVNDTSAVGIFLILNNGGAPITARGLCFSTDGINYIYVPSTTMNVTDIGTFKVNLSSLSPNTTYYVKSYAINSAGTAYSSQTSFKTTSLPVINTTTPNRISGYDAYSGGTVLYVGDEKLQARGICWSKDTIPTIELSTKTSEAISGSGIGGFTSHLTGLIPSVKYYVRAYAINSFGIEYGNLDSLVTNTLASITTIRPSAMTSTSAVSGGTISDNGGCEVTSRGICWATTPNPTTLNSYTSNGSGTGTFITTLSNLMGSTKYYVRAYAINCVGITYGNQDSLVTAPPVLPAVRTTDVINIGSNTATGRGYVVNAGGGTISERGICWNATGDPTIDDNHAAAGVGLGSFSATITGLAPVAKYYMRAYAINEIGITYGDVLTFTTFTIPTLTTSAVSSVTNTTATSGGSIVSDGGTPVTDSGICWSTSPNPTVNNAHTTSTTGVGSFIHGITGLMGSTTYYVRAYAINYAGTAYGQQETFTTAPPVLATLTTNQGYSWDDGLHGTSGGTILNNGGGVISIVGLVWSTTSGFNPDTVVINKATKIGSGNFSSTMSNLKLGTTYYARAYVTNSAGTSYANNETSFTTYDYPIVSTSIPSNATISNVSAKIEGNIVSNGGTSISESGICWSEESTPTIADNHTSNGSGMGSFSHTITNLMGSTTYFARAYAINSVGISYGNIVSFTTAPPTLASIATTVPYATSSSTGSAGGNITSNGGALVSTRGVVWSTVSGFNPDTVIYNKTATTGYFVGSFKSQISGLKAETIYYVRAYVENSVGISYGEEMNFITPTLATLTTSYAIANGPTKGTSGGIISNDGGASVTKRGVIWSTSMYFDADAAQIDATDDGSGIGTYSSLLTGLRGNTTYYVKAFATNIAGTSFGNTLSFITDPATLATLTTREAWNISGTYAYSGGYISDNGGEPVTTRGILWSTKSGFRPDTVVVNKTTMTGSGNGNFTSVATGLKMGTTYYVRSYAINSIGIAYGNEISFTTLDLPKVTTMPAAAGSSGYNASGGGTLISDGGASVTNQGVCWSTNHNPTVGLYTHTSYDPWAGNSFYSSITDLQPVTTYYVRAYASNSQGIAYGEEVSFTTPVAMPTITTNVITATSKSTAATGGKITTDGGGTITAKGVIWSTDPAFNPDTVVVNRTSDGTGSSNFTSIISGLKLSTAYYVRAYATNSAGTSYGNQVTITIYPTSPMLVTVDPTAVTGSSSTSGGIITSDGGVDITQKGICWATHTNPTIADYKTNNGAGTDSYIANITALLPNTLYYVRAYAINKIGVAYGAEKMILTNGVPILSATLPASNIIATTATSGGEITDDGRSPILSRGICWSIFSNPTIALSTKTVDTSSPTIGSFFANMTALQPNTTYYVRAYATNAVGVGYGSEIAFTTLPVMLPSLVTVTPYAIDSVTATCGGNVIDDGGMPVTVRGVCWSTSPNPTTALTTKINNATGGIGLYTNVIAGLSPGTKYYVRAYAINTQGTAYGNLDSLKTMAVKPTVSNVVMSNLSDSSGVSNATIIYDGGDPVTDRGFCWNTTGTPTLSDHVLPVGSGIGAIQDTLYSLNPKETYYIRAYAVNGSGVGYSPTVTSFKICPSSFDIIHAEGLNGAALSKTVTYHSISTEMSGKAACWITQNLGADHQASSVTDATEPSAGWYWQFNRVQGYQYTTARYPLSWATTFSENSDWQPANDPCSLLLGNGWRMPTYTEWNNAKGSPQNWTNGSIAFNSVLKLHYAGYLGNGAIVNRGVQGNHWSSTQYSNTEGRYTGYNSTTFGMTATDANSKSKYAFTLRCLRDTVYISSPTVSNVTLTNMTDSVVDLNAVATLDGGTPVTNRGFCWSITNPNPTMSDNVIYAGNGLGNITKSLDSLKQGMTYYVRAFATNSTGTAYSAAVTPFKICPPSLTIQHFEGIDGAPVTKTVTYNIISSNISGKPACWLTQNLGADHPATSATDATEASAGWYWQFNNAQGYQYHAARYPSSWISNINEDSNWLTTNDPCSLLLGIGWRIPTNSEWTIADGSTQNWTSYTGTYGSVIKLHAAGYLNAGTITARGSVGEYWSSSQFSTDNAFNIAISSSVSEIQNHVKSTYAFSVRCLWDTVVLNKPTVRNITFTDITSASVNVEAIATPDGGSPITERGFCWNTTGNPTIADNKIIDASAGTGLFSTTLTGLTPATTYYIRAYATNSQGTGYSSSLDSFTTTLPLTVSSIVPPTGPTAGFTNVAITGTNFIAPNLGGDAGWESVAGKSLPTALYGAQQAVIGNKVYLFGGYNGSAYVNTIFSALVSDPTTWSNTGKTLPGNLYLSQLITVGNNLYLLGGTNGSANNVIYTASTSDPTTWSNTGKTLPGNLYASQVARVGDNLYLFGGNNGTSATNIIYSASINDPTTWSNTGKTLPGNLCGSQLATIGNNLYLFGGNNGSTYTNVIYSALVSDPTAWSNTGKTLPSFKGYAQLVSIGDSLHLYGGNNGSANTSSIFTASIDDPTTWATSPNTLPANLNLSHVAVINNYAYLFGGYTTAATNAIYRAPLRHSRPNVYNNPWKTNWRTIPTDYSNVTIGGNQASYVHYASPTSITATTPAHPSGSTDVVVTNFDGQSATLSNGFTYLLPTISSISPDNGPVAGGTNVTITGTNFVGSFGTETDGPITIDANKNINTDAISIGRTCPDAVNFSVMGLTSNTATLDISPDAGCLAVGDEVLLINLQGNSTNNANVGNYETLRIQNISSNVVTFSTNKTKYYGNNTNDDTNIGTSATSQRVMLQRVPNYTNVTINPEATLTADAWDGTKGGVLYFKASGTVINNGTIDMSGNGYRGGSGVTGNTSGRRGESYPGYPNDQTYLNFFGAGGGGRYYDGDGDVGVGGGGGSYGTAGNAASSWTGATGGYAGSVYGTSNLSTIYLGSGGGSGGADSDNQVGYGGAGGRGGGIIMLSAGTLTNRGSIKSNGSNGAAAYDPGDGEPGSGGGGSGGSILLNALNAGLGSNTVLANGGTGGTASWYGGNGGLGRVALLYRNNISGSSTPDAYAQQVSGGTTIRLSFEGSLVYGTVVNSTTIVVNSPSHPAGVVDVTATNCDGQSATYTNGYTYNLPPTISSITPATSLAAGGISVTISGSDFVDVPTVKFGKTAATSVTRLNANTLIATVPPHAVGTYDVIVTNPDGQTSTLTNVFSFNELAPTISSISPDNGPTSGGTNVTIAGSNFILPNSGGNTNWTAITGKTLPSALFGAQLTLVNDTIYLFGGYNGTAYVNTIFSAPASDPGSWTNTGKILPDNLYLPQLVTVGTNLYLFGGYNGAANNTIYTASISNPTTWSVVSGKTLPGNLYGSQLAIVGNNLYLFGGNNGTTATNTIYSAPVTDPTNWTNTGKTLPGSLFASQIATIGNTLYLFGGYNGSAYINSIYSAPISDPTNWTNTGKTLPAVRGYAQILAMGDSLYLVGGYNGTASTSAILTASIADPTTWKTSSSTLPIALRTSSLAVIDNNAYLFGGYTTAATNALYIAPLSHNRPNVYNNPWITNWRTIAEDQSNVTIGGIQATNINVANSTTITAQTPAHPSGTTDVVITNYDGQSATLTNGYTFNEPPTISSITPATSLAAGGITVTISGSNFLQTPIVKFGKVNATSVNRVDASTLSVVVPAHAVGPYDIIVINPDMQADTLANAFTFEELAPTVSSISPDNGPTSGGTNVTISGTNFIPPNSGGNTNWTIVNGKTLPGKLYGSQLAVIEDSIYLFGGHNGSAATNVIYTAPVSDPTNWTNTGKTLPGSSYWSSLIRVADKLYLFGGYNGASMNTIYSASVSTPTVWTNTGKTLPVATHASQICTIGDYIYLFGGYSTSLLSSIYRAPVTDPTNWTNTGKTLPSGSYTGAVSVIGDHVYIFGGNTGSYNKIIYSAPVSDPTNWTNTGKTLPGALGLSQLITIGDFNYLLGGYNGSAGISAIYKSSVADPINWTVDSGSLSAALYGAQTAILNDSIYLFGGYNSTYTNAIYRAPLNRNRPNVYNKPWITNWRTIAEDQSNVTIGGIQATNINVANSTTITAKTPAHPSGATDVVITNYDGQSATLTNGYTFNEPPSISNITPAASLATGGITVTISGSYFLQTPIVRFGKVNATSVTRIDANTLRVVVPAHAVGSYDLVVVNPDMQADTLALGFTFIELAPTISSISPDNGPTSGGTNVTISGTNFIPPNSGGDTNWAIVNGKTLPGKLYGSQLAVIEDSIYLFGGYNGSAATNVIYTAPVNNPTNWSNTGKILPGSSYLSKLIRVGEKLYLLGGYNGASMNTIYSASVSAPTVWTNTGKTLPVATHASLICTIGDYIYLFGGYSTAVLNSIYRAPIADPTTWINTGKTLPSGTYNGAVSVIGDHVYIFGGNTGSYNGIIYSAPVADPTTWTNTGKTLPGALGHAQLITVGDFNYLLGGYNGSAGISTIYKSSVTDPIHWSVASATLPAALYGYQTAILNDSVYLFGGYNSTYTNAIYRAPLKNNRPNVYNNPWQTNWRTISTDQSNVTIGGNQATNINFASATSITATTPAHHSGATDVIVTNYDGQSATLSNAFTYVAPTITSISPNNGTITGGTNVTITGTNFFGSDSGTGLDGAITIDANKNINTDAISSGRTCADAVNFSVTGLTANTATLATTPGTGCLAVGDEILLINLQGTSTNNANVGNYETLKIQSIAANVITFTTNKTKYYGNNTTDDTNIGTLTTNQRVMLQRVPNYSDLTINTGVTLTADAWDGTKGGVLYLKANGTVVNNGTIDMSGKGYRGGSGGNGNTSGRRGESTPGYPNDQTYVNFGGGGGGGRYLSESIGDNGGGGGGGSYGTAGTSGSYYSNAYGGYTGTTYGTANLSTIHLGSGGGGGAGDTDNQVGNGGAGGKGGGIIMLSIGNLSNKGTISATGSNGASAYDPGDGEPGSGGGGAGGSILLNANNAAMGSNSVIATGGAGGAVWYTGGSGGQGRVALLYRNNISGLSNPDAYTQQIYGGATIRILFGGTTTFGTVVNSTTIVVLAPPNTAGATDVTVSNPDGESATLANGYLYW